MAEDYGNLITGRRPGESIVIGEETIITVLEIVGNKVRLGIKAPRGVAIHRLEILPEKHRAHEIARVQ